MESRFVKPPGPDEIGARIAEVKVAADQASCGQSTNVVSLIATGQFPEIDLASVVLYPDEGRLKMKGQHLKGLQIRWQAPQKDGQDVCLDPQPSGKQEQCVIPVGGELPGDTSLRWMPPRARFDTDVTTYDENGARVDASGFVLRPARVVIANMFPASGSVDVSQGPGRVPLVHPETVISVDCGQARCDLADGAVMVRSFSPIATTVSVRLRLGPRFFLAHGTAQEQVVTATLVLHVGDIVDTSNDQAQWAVANSSMRVLDGIVPYVLVPGNHGTDANRVGPIDSYFAPATMPWIAGTMTADQIENNYALVDIGPRKWLVLGLEFGPRDATLTWADGVLKTYPMLPAIIVTHAYLDQNGHRYDIAVSGLDQNQPTYQRFIPQAFGYTPKEGINDGEQIWRKLILPNANVRLAFCGHANGAARLTSSRPDGSHAHQILSDYQWLETGAANHTGDSGYLRLLEFDYAKKEIRVQTYSPYLDEFMTDDANQFTVSLDLEDLPAVAAVVPR